VIVPSFPISSITSAIKLQTSSSCAEIVATCLISSLFLIGFACAFKSETTLSIVLCKPLPRAKGFTPDLINLSHSFDIA
jgi:Ca2+/Na+ antiporter